MKVFLPLFALFFSFTSIAFADDLFFGAQCKIITRGGDIPSDLMNIEDTISFKQLSDPAQSPFNLMDAKGLNIPFLGDFKLTSVEVANNTKLVYQSNRYQEVQAFVFTKKSPGRIFGKKHFKAHLITTGPVVFYNLACEVL